MSELRSYVLVHTSIDHGVKIQSARTFNRLYMNMLPKRNYCMLVCVVQECQAETSRQQVCH